MKFESISLDLIDPPRDDDRLERSPETVLAIAASIGRNGLINPVTVEPREGRYECVAGWTRVLAQRRLGWPTTNAQICTPMERAQRAHMRLAENLDRSDLTPIEEARRLSAIQVAEALGVDELAALVHRSTDWVGSRLGLLEIPEDLQAHVHLRSLSIGAALALARCTDPQHRAYLLQYALEGGATIESVRAWVREWEVHVSSGSTEPAPVPSLPVLNQRPTVTMPCARCHREHDVRESCIIRVCQSCGREIEQELRHPAPTTEDA